MSQLPGRSFPGRQTPGQPFPSPVFPGLRTPGSGKTDSPSGDVDNTATGKTVLGTVSGDRVSILTVDDDGSDAEYQVLLNDAVTDSTVTAGDVEVAVEVTATGTGSSTFTVETVSTTTA